VQSPVFPLDSPGQLPQRLTVSFFGLADDCVFFCLSVFTSAKQDNLLLGSEPLHKDRLFIIAPLDGLEGFPLLKVFSLGVGSPRKWCPVGALPDV